MLTDKHFVLPIEFSNNVYNTPENIFNDLELLKTTEPSNNTIYEFLLKPKTEIGKLGVKQWASKYTTDKTYLRNTQQIIETMECADTNDTVVDAWKNYNTMKNDKGFIGKFQYINWEKFKFLNSSAMFMTILSAYSIMSPLLNLIAPLLILLIPFFLMRFKKMPINITTYFAILLASIKTHSLGKLITQWRSMSWSQGMYLIFMSGMYFYNIYQNAISCYTFYKNTYIINNDIRILTKYIKHTDTKINGYLDIIKDLPGYAKYSEYLKTKQQTLADLYDTLKLIPTDGNLYNKSQYIGYTMKHYYELYSDVDIESCLLFSFGFHGYLENMSNIIMLKNNKEVAKAKFITSKTPTLKIKKGYFPIIQTDKIIKNSISLRKNKLITGPNASGKTTLLKSTIVNILVSQQIGYGFYKSSVITPFDFIHSYLNIPDTSCRDSLFQAEARRCLDILNTIKKNDDKKHFCIFDELYSGTNPYEAISGAKAYLEEICNYKQVKFMLTTHYIQLCEQLNTHENISNINMAFEFKGTKPDYKYKIKEGVSKVKGGVTVLRDLGYPEHIIDNAIKNVNKL
tara:strand:- start:530 stop:2239 length:1710 start_codon:yes stop_codon:yes gene_type:complete